jgi:hypothetical protein
VTDIAYLYLQWYFKSWFAVLQQTWQESEYCCAPCYYRFSTEKKHNELNNDLLQSTSKFDALFLHPVPIQNPEGTSQIREVFNSFSFALNTLPWVSLDYLSIQKKEMNSSSIHLIKFMSIFTLPNSAAFGTWDTTILKLWPRSRIKLYAHTWTQLLKCNNTINC